MYFSDAYPDPTQDEIHSFKTAERRLLVRLAVIGCFSLVLLGIALI